MTARDATSTGIPQLDILMGGGLPPRNTLVISGDQDPSTPVERQQLIVGMIAGARHEIVAPGAHLAAVEQPDTVNRLILEHLRTKGETR